MAAVITRQIGHTARATPSRAPDRIMIGSLEKPKAGITAIRKEDMAAMEVTFQAGNLRIARATIIQRIGNRARSVVMEDPFHDKSDIKDKLKL